MESLHGRIVAAGRPVAAIALNAGIGAGGAFATGTELRGRASRFMPDRLKAAVHRRMAEPGSAGDEE